MMGLFNKEPKPDPHEAMMAKLEELRQAVQLPVKITPTLQEEISRTFIEHQGEMVRLSAEEAAKAIIPRLDKVEKGISAALAASGKEVSEIKKLMKENGLEADDFMSRAEASLESVSQKAALKVQQAGEINRKSAETFAALAQELQGVIKSIQESNKDIAGSYREINKSIVSLRGEVAQTNERFNALAAQMSRVEELAKEPETRLESLRSQKKAIEADILKAKQEYAEFIKRFAPPVSPAAHVQENLPANEADIAVDEAFKAQMTEKAENALQKGSHPNQTFPGLISKYAMGDQSKVLFLRGIQKVYLERYQQMKVAGTLPSKKKHA